MEAAKRARGSNQGPLVAGLCAAFDGFGGNGLDGETGRRGSVEWLLLGLQLLCQLSAAVAACKTFKVSTHGCGSSNIVNERIVEEG